MSLETLRLEHLPSSHRVHAALFRSVSNAGFLHGQLLERNPAFEYAFVDAAVVASRVHLLAAIYRAVTSLLAGSLKTPNVHSEIVCSLSASNNISEAYRRYGISPTTKDVIVVKVLFPTESRPEASLPTAQDVWAHLLEHVQGEPADFTDETLASITDWARVRKYYKLNGAPAVDAAKTEADKAREREALILGAMALRGL